MTASPQVAHIEDTTVPVPEFSPPPKRAPRFASPVAVACGILTLVLVWQWYDVRSQLSAVREELAQRLRENEAESRDARVAARQTQEGLREAQSKLAQLELKLAESQKQQAALESLYQEVSRSRDDWVLAEIEQILTIASQQLQLAGNVPAALAALQTVEARLARSDRPQWAPLRKALSGDIERLKSASHADIQGMAAQLDQLIFGADSLPLAQAVRPRAGVETAAAPAQVGFWAQLWAGLLDELKQLVLVENIERPDPVLLNPSQTFFLRENLKLRLLNARLALMAHDEAAFRSDVKVAANWVDRYFDTRSGDGATARENLKQLGSSGVRIALPNVGDSLAALRSYKASRTRTAR